MYTEIEQMVWCPVAATTIGGVWRRARCFVKDGRVAWMIVYG